MEALMLLRQCTMARKIVREDKDHYVFGNRRVPKGTPTAWKSQMQSEVSRSSRGASSVPCKLVIAWGKTAVGKATAESCSRYTCAS